MTTKYREMGARQLSVSQGLEVSLTARGMRLKDLDVPLAQSTKSMIKNGKRKMPRDLVRTFQEQVRHPAFAMGAAVELAGVGSLWLNGPNVDIHRSSVKERAVIEVQEALEALVRFRSGNPPATMTESDHRKLGELLTELLDARQWIDFCAAVLCEDYGKDFLQVNGEHHQRLKSMRLVME